MKSGRAARARAHKELHPVVRLQRGDRKGLLAREAKQLTACHDHLKSWAGGQELTDPGSGLNDVLEIVEQKKQRLIADVLGQAASGVDRLRRGIQNELGVAQGASGTQNRPSG